MILKKNKQLNASGFTLVEVMTAVMIMSIGLVGGLTLINYNLRNISSGEKKIVATSLAAEGIELARNVRDTNWLQESAANWNLDIEGINSSNTTIKFFCGGDDHRQIPSSPQTLTACGEDCRMYVYTKTANPGLGAQCYSDDFNKPGYSKVATNFYRLITLDNESSVDHVKVQVDVKWVSGTQTYNVTASEILYNWK